MWISARGCAEPIRNCDPCSVAEMIQMRRAFSSECVLFYDPVDRENDLETPSLYFSKCNLQYKTHAKNTQQVIVLNISIQDRILLVH